MTTAHRPTFDPARGREARRGPAYHQRLQPSHTHLKVRQPGQGGEGDATAPRDLRSELLKAEAAVKAKKDRGTVEDDVEDGGVISAAEEGAEEGARPKRKLGGLTGGTSDVTSQEREGEEHAEDPEAKRRRLVLEQAATLDADSAPSSPGSSKSSGADSDASSSDNDDDDDSDDEEAELLRELAKIKAERAAVRAASEERRAQVEQEQREVDIALGNPLLNTKPQDYGLKRRWDDDVVFKNQARGTEDRDKGQGFVNDLLRSDFHKRFMSRYVR